MQKRQTFQPDGFWLVTFAAITWGTIGVATQTIYNIDTTTSLFINLARMLIATPVLLIACWRVIGPRMFTIDRRGLLIMLLSGTLLAISHAAYFAAIRSSGVTIATLLTICVAPLFVTCVSVALKLEILTGRIVAALIAALVGAVLLVSGGSPASESGQHDVALGTVFSLIAAATYGSSVICGRFLAGDYHPLQVTTITFSAGTIVLIVVNLLAGMITVHTTQGWLLVLYLGLVPTALAYWLFQRGLRSVSATSASIVSMVDPLVAALLAWVLFGETLSLMGIIGAVLLTSSLFLLSVHQRE
ncbi:MAG: EamA family transporter [Burkholderiales bacterium]|nr:EamA family transporter [Anaerolineae bacterium]